MQKSSRVRRRPSKSLLGLALAGATATMLLSACSFSMQDAQCSGGEYPVLAVNGSGGACVEDGQEPPKGYARYPEGKVPEYVDDKWDKYWNTHTLDENGKIITIPEGQ
ncbi:SCO0607 family lipoprotein [Streptomyces sp. T028]|uniref:SCO0607 family lipoprotein n=1 Tax=Streptomyces sp. T028 TaxID=3394379 RepID=UPI003A8B87FA